MQAVLDIVSTVVGGRVANALSDACDKGSTEDEALPFVDLHVELMFCVPVEIWIDCLRGVKHSKCAYKILFLLEPDCITQIKAALTADIVCRFAVIFTHDAEVLRSTPRCVMFQHGGTWIQRTFYSQSAALMRAAKRCAISFVCGSKLCTVGHRLRHDLWKVQTLLDPSRRLFYISGQSPWAVPRVAGARVAKMLVDMCCACAAD